MRQPRSTIPDVGKVEKRGFPELPLNCKGPVLISRQCQPISRIPDRRRPVRETRVDEGRENDAIPGEALVQMERRIQTIGQVRRSRHRLEAPNRRRSLAERHSRVVDAVPASKHSLVGQLVREAKSGSECVDRDLVECMLT